MIEQDRKIILQAIEALTQIASCAIGTDFGREFEYQVDISVSAIAALRTLLEKQEQKGVIELLEDERKSYESI